MFLHVATHVLFAFEHTIYIHAPGRPPYIASVGCETLRSTVCWSEVGLISARTQKFPFCGNQDGMEDRQSSFTVTIFYILNDKITVRHYKRIDPQHRQSTARYTESRMRASTSNASSTCHNHSIANQSAMSASGDGRAARRR